MRDLIQIQLAAADGNRRNETDRRYAIILRGHQRNPSTLAVTHDRQAFAVDILAIAHHFDGSPGVFSKVLEPGGFGPAAALSDAALVVAQDDESGVGQRVGN